MGSSAYRLMLGLSADRLMLAYRLIGLSANARKGSPLKTPWVPLGPPQALPPWALPVPGPLGPGPWALGPGAAKTNDSSQKTNDSSQKNHDTSKKNQ